MVIRGKNILYSTPPAYWKKFSYCGRGKELAGNHCSLKANKSMKSIPTHHIGRLKVISAKIEIPLSRELPALWADLRPIRIPIIEYMIPAVVNRRIDLGKTSLIIVETSLLPVGDGNL